MITAEQLRRATGATPANAAKWLPAIQAAMTKFGITTTKRQAAFLSQCGHESVGFSRLEENLNYAEAALLKLWPKRITPEQAKRYGRNDAHAATPEAIANLAYSDRMGNGDFFSGEGFAYRGRGPLQITGKRNYLLCGLAIGRDLLSRPDDLLQPEAGAMSAAWFFHTNGCNKLADDGDMIAISVLINGGKNGMDERLALWNEASSALA